jgi:nitroimidazol reductase NimA-like FMN-containing flavoprotein (pyridoxamine 5'-phosphate oxidase superfamily)
MEPREQREHREPSPSSERSRVRRLSKRGRYDRATIDAILDEGLVCHVGFEMDGYPCVIPMGYARDGDRLFLHGSVASRLASHLARGVEVCVTVTLVDGLVLARSTFHHSMNYRSVVVFGRAKVIDDEIEKRRALDLPSDEELAATEVLEIPLDEVSAKVRMGPPGDNKEDLVLDVWAGVVPLRLEPGPPVEAPDLRPGIDEPGYVSRYRRPGRRSQGDESE